MVVLYDCRVVRRAVSRAACAAVTVLTIAVGGCASSDAERQHAYQMHAAAMAAQRAQTARVEIEDDGLPSQAPPLRRPQHPDDPTEPYSPNYGRGVPGSAPAGAPLPSKRAEAPRGDAYSPADRIMSHTQVR